MIVPCHERYANSVQVQAKSPATPDDSDRVAGKDRGKACSSGGRSQPYPSKSDSSYRVGSSVSITVRALLEILSFSTSEVLSVTHLTVPPHPLIEPVSAPLIT